MQRNEYDIMTNFVYVYVQVEVPDLLLFSKDAVAQGYNKRLLHPGHPLT
jgi:hypothetical protein